MGTIKRFLKNYKFSIPALLILIIAGALFFATRGEKGVRADTIVASRTAVVEEVNVTGRVVPAEEVELGVQSGGKVAAIPARVGETVSSGQILLRVDSSDLQIRLGRQRAALEKARIELEKQEPKTTAADDLEKAYENGFNAVADAFLDVPTIVTGLDNVLDADVISNNALGMRYGDRAQEYRKDAVRHYYAADKAYDMVFALYKTLSRESSDEAIETLILETYDALRVIADAVKVTNGFVDYVENKMETEDRPDLAAIQTQLDEYTSESNEHLSNLLEIKDVIEDSHEGVTDESLDVQSIRIDVRQAELDVQDTLLQFENRLMKSPVTGIVTDIEAEVGETILSGSPVISVISSGQYEIEANIPEADMAKVRVGAATEVTLDAYGSDVIFAARVVSVNPSETLIDGVATYRTKFQFLENDERIKSGMTATLIIRGERKENVISVPQRSVISRGVEKYIQVLEEGKIVEKQVETGLRGSDGSIEIISGIEEGENVVVFTEK